MFRGDPGDPRSFAGLLSEGREGSCARHMVATGAAIRRIPRPDGELKLVSAAKLVQARVPVDPARRTADEGARTRAGESGTKSALIWSTDDPAGGFRRGFPPLACSRSGATSRLSNDEVVNPLKSRSDYDFLAAAPRMTLALESGECQASSSPPDGTLPRSPLSQIGRRPDHEDPSPARPDSRQA